MSKKVLFINLGGIGDEIMFLPAIISYKFANPEDEIVLALEKRSAGITELTNLIDKIIVVNKTKPGMVKLLFQMIFGRYDKVISSGSNKLICLLLFLSRIKCRAGYDSGILSRKLLTHPVRLDKGRYAVKMYHELVKPFTNKVTELPQFTVKKVPVKPDTILIHPGVSKKSIFAGIIKTITPEEWAELIANLSDKGREIILTGGNDDIETLEAIKFRLAPKTVEEIITPSLYELAQLISGAEIFICSDSAPLHIAVGMGTRTFVFFGPTDYKKLIPENNLITPILSNYDCPLRPCLWDKRNTSCQKHKCLNFNLKEIAKIILNDRGKKT